MDDYMLTTIDNPYNPYTHFNEWYSYDVQQGYYTTSYLARVTNTSSELSEYDEELAIKDAIDAIVKENVLGIYKKIRSDDVIDLTKISMPKVS